MRGEAKGTSILKERVISSSHAKVFINTRLPCFEPIALYGRGSNARICDVAELVV
jgi:hypothetical protein